MIIISLRNVIPVDRAASRFLVKLDLFLRFKKKRTDEYDNRVVFRILWNIYDGALRTKIVNG